MELRSCPLRSICDYVKELQENSAILPSHEILLLDEKGYHCGALRRVGERSNSCSYIEMINNIHGMKKKPNGFRDWIGRFF